MGSSLEIGLEIESESSLDIGLGSSVEIVLESSVEIELGCSLEIALGNLLEIGLGSSVEIVFGDWIGDWRNYNGNGCHMHHNILKLGIYATLVSTELTTDGHTNGII